MDKNQSKQQPKEDGPMLGWSQEDELTCEEYREEIHLVIGGDLEQEVLDLLVAHLAACEPCADKTALAAQARIALQAGLDGEAQAWREPKLWPQVRSLLKQENDGRVDVAAEAATLAPILQFTKAAGKVVLPLAAAVALFVMLKTDGAGNSQPASSDPNPSGTEEHLVLVPNAAGDSVSPDGSSHGSLHGSSQGPGWFTGADTPQLADAGLGQNPSQGFAALTEGVPPGLLEPLSLEDQHELERASRLRVDVDAERNLLRIRQGSAVLTSLPYSH